MQLRTGIVALAILATVALPSAAAAVDLTASSLSSPIPGRAELDGSIIQWFTRDASTNSAQLRLHAEHLHVETDSAPYFYGGVTAVGTTPPTTTTNDYESATVTGANWYNETSIYIVPVGDLTTQLQASDQDVGIPQAACAMQPLFFPGARQPLCPDLSASFTVQASAHELGLNGSFDLFLWGWQGTIVHRDGSTPYWTGSQFTAPQPPGSTGVGPAESRFIKMAVRNGTLAIDLAEASSLDIHSAEGVFSLEEATFTESSLSTASGAVLDVRRATDRLAITIQTGTVTDVEGQTIVVGPNVAESGWWSWWFALLVLPAILGTWVSSRGPSHVRQAADNLALGNPAAAHRHAEAARHWPWSRRRANTLAVIALPKSHRFDDAELAIARMRQARGDGAAADFLTAYLETERGHMDRAREALRRAIQLNGQYRVEAAAHPALRALLPAGEGA